MKHIANIITSSRIILSFVLLFLPPLSCAFFILYALCGFSDMIDGVVAKHFGSVSRFGALLDSVADIVFITVSALRLSRVLFPLFPGWWIYAVIAIIAVKLASLFAGFVKFRKPCFLHTYPNKITGVVVFLLPFFYTLQCYPFVVGFVCTVAFISATDEFICLVKMKEYNPDCKGFIF